MKEFLQRIKLNVLLSALLSIFLGIILIIYPDNVTIFVCKLIGIILIIMGIVIFVPAITSPGSRAPLAGGIIIFLLGLFIYFNPATVASLIPAFIGVMMIVHGAEDFRLALEIKDRNGDNWLMVMLLAVVTFVLGFICIISAFQIVTLGVIIIGISLIYDGISDLFIVSRVSTAYKNFKQDASAIDTTYTEK